MARPRKKVTLEIAYFVFRYIQNRIDDRQSLSVLVCDTYAYDTEPVKIAFSRLPLKRHEVDRLEGRSIDVYRNHPEPAVLDHFCAKFISSTGWEKILGARRQKTLRDNSPGKLKRIDVERVTAKRFERFCREQATLDKKRGKGAGNDKLTVSEGLQRLLDMAETTTAQQAQSNKFSLETCD